MIITELKKSIRFKKLTEVYIDYEYAFSLYENEIKDFSVEVNKEIDEDKLGIIFKKLEKNATNDILKYISISDCTKKMAEDKLKQKKYPQTVIEAVLSLVCDKGYIDDSDYARNFVKSCVSKGKGKKYIEYELKSKGISEETAENLILEYYKGDSVYDVAEKKMNAIIKGRPAPDYKDLNKLRDYLIRNGFCYDEVSDALLRMKGKMYD